MSPKRTLRIRICMLGVGALAAVSLSACGSEASDTTTPAETTTAAVAETTTSPAETTPPGADTATPDTAATAETSAAAADAAAVQGVILTDGEAPAERTIAVVGQAFQPNTLTIKVGDTVTFRAGDKLISSVIVGDLPGATVTGGLIETFQFSIPGTYPVKEDVSGNTATIIVE